MGPHHKQWVLDQIVRISKDCPEVTVTAKDCHGKEYSFQDLGESKKYKEWVRNYNNGEEGPDTYKWDIGIAPLNKQEIFPVQYNRTDNKVTAIKVKNGWVLRSILGLAWFYNGHTGTWDISSVPGFDYQSDPYVMSIENALHLLSVISPKLL